MRRVNDSGRAEEAICGYSHKLRELRRFERRVRDASEGVPGEMQNFIRVRLARAARIHLRGAAAKGKRARRRPPPR